MQQTNKQSSSHHHLKSQDHLFDTINMNDENSKNDYLKNAIAATNKQASKLTQLHRFHATIMQLMQLLIDRNKQMQKTNKCKKETNIKKHTQ